MKGTSWQTINIINRVGEKLYWDWPMDKHLDTQRKSADGEVYLIQLYVVSWSVRSFHMFVLYKVCQWLATSQWFSLCTLVSSTNKADCHNVFEILLKVALNSITLNPIVTNFFSTCFVSGSCILEGHLMWTSYYILLFSFDLSRFQSAFQWINKLLDRSRWQGDCITTHGSKGSDNTGFRNYYGSSGTSYIYIYVCYALFKTQTYTAV